MEGFSDGGSTPPASTKRIACNRYWLQAFSLFYSHSTSKMLAVLFSHFLSTPNFTPYRFETFFISRSILSWESFRMVSDTAA